MPAPIEASAMVVPAAHRRRLHRREDLCFRIRFQVLSDDQALHTLNRLEPVDGPSTGGDCYTQNISQGGLGFCGDLRALRDHSIEEGDFLEMEIHPPNTRASLRCIGAVAWIKVDRDAEVFWAGVSFVAVKADDLEAMRRR